MVVVVKEEERRKEEGGEGRRRRQGGGRRALRMVDGSPCGYVSTAKVPSCSFQMCRSVCASTRIRAHTCACTCVQACACVCAVRSPARGEKGMRDCAHYAHAKRGIQGKRRGGGVSRDRQENLDAHRFHPAAALPVSALRGIRQPPPLRPLRTTVTLPPHRASVGPGPACGMGPT